MLIHKNRYYIISSNLRLKKTILATINAEHFTSNNQPLFNASLNRRFVNPLIIYKQ